MVVVSQGGEPGWADSVPEAEGVQDSPPASFLHRAEGSGLGVQVLLCVQNVRKMDKVGNLGLEVHAWEHKLQHSFITFLRHYYVWAAVR